MRRAEREMNDPAFMHQVLRNAGEIYLAMNNGGAPYLVPVNFVFHAGDIFFHCALDGTKVSLLRRDPRVAFSTAVDIRIEGTTTRYRSVCGTGRAEFVEDAAKKSEALMAFAARFQAPCRFPVSGEKLAAAGVVRIRIESLSGKYSRPSEGPRPVPHYEF